MADSMKKSSSRPRLSQPSGDGSQTVEFFFHNAHFPILGELSKKRPTNLRERPTLSHALSTCLGVFTCRGFCTNVASVDIFLGAKRLAETSCGLEPNEPPLLPGPELSPSVIRHQEKERAHPRLSSPKRTSHRSRQLFTSSHFSASRMPHARSRAMRATP